MSFFMVTSFGKNQGKKLHWRLPNSGWSDGIPVVKLLFVLSALFALLVFVPAAHLLAGDPTPSIPTALTPGTEADKIMKQYWSDQIKLQEGLLAKLKPARDKLFKELKIEEGNKVEKLITEISALVEESKAVLSPNAGSLVLKRASGTWGIPFNERTVVIHTNGAWEDVPFAGAKAGNISVGTWSIVGNDVQLVDKRGTLIYTLHVEASTFGVEAAPGDTVPVTRVDLRVKGNFIRVGPVTAPAPTIEKK